MSMLHSFFTSPLEGEVVRRSNSEGGREGGISLPAQSKLPPSLTLPRKGGGDAQCRGHGR